MGITWESDRAESGETKQDVLSLDFQYFARILIFRWTVWDASFGPFTAVTRVRISLGTPLKSSTALLGFEFFEKLKTVEDRWDIEITKGPKKPIVDSLDRILADIDDALKVRHVLCHETAPFHRVSEADANRMLESGKKFTGAVSWLTSETLSPNEPLTQTDMNISASKRAAEAEEDLNKEVDLLREKLDEEDKSLLAESQEAWGKYRRAFSELEGNAAKGGSMRPMLFAGSMETMTRNRLLEIRECLRQDGLGGKPKRRRRPH